MSINYRYHLQSTSTSTPTYNFLHNTSVTFKSTSTNLVESKAYTYNYSSYYEWLHQNTNTIIQCYLTRKNHMILNNKHLIIKKLHNKEFFPLREIRSINLAFKRLILPIIIGGIISPLSLLATMHHIIDLSLGLFITLFGLLIFYYGWLGSYQIDVIFKTHKISYFSNEKSVNLNRLISQGNKMIRDRYDVG